MLKSKATLFDTHENFQGGHRETSLQEADGGAAQLHVLAADGQSSTLPLHRQNNGAVEIKTSEISWPFVLVP